MPGLIATRRRVVLVTLAALAVLDAGRSAYTFGLGPSPIPGCR